MRCPIDPLNLILLVIVIFVGAKLRSVLGMRNDEDHGKTRRGAYGLNREAFDKNKTKGTAETAGRDAPSHLRVVETPDDGATEQGADTTPEPNPEPVEAPNGRGIAFLRETDPSFDADGFVDGAARAYELILTAFAEGQLETVRDFLNADVYAGFEDAVHAREAAGETLVTKILRLDRPVLEDARLEDGQVQLDVRFRAELISYLQKGPPSDPENPDAEPAPSRDLWTFERALKADNPNWVLIATQTEQ